MLCCRLKRLLGNRWSLRGYSSPVLTNEADCVAQVAPHTPATQDFVNDCVKVVNGTTIGRHYGDCCGDNSCPDELNGFSNPCTNPGLLGPDIEDCSWIYSQGLHTETISIQYLRSLYYSVTTVTSIGYGDISPITMEETMLVIVFETLAAAFFAVVFAVVTTVFTQIVERETNHMSMLSTVHNQMAVLNLPTSIRTKVGVCTGIVVVFRSNVGDTVVLRRHVHSIVHDVK